MNRLPGIAMLDALAADLRYAVRLLARNPGFALVAVATLAIGIGANTAIFSVVDHVLLRPLAYRDAARLYAVHEVVPKLAHVAPLIPVNAMHFAEWRRSLRSFERLALVSGAAMTLGGSGTPELVNTARVTPALLPMLGAEPALGRVLRDDEDAPGRDGVVVIDYELWERRFDRSADVLGRKILLDGRPFEIVGVLPASFRFPRISSLYAMTVQEQRPQIWRPFAVKPDELVPLGDFNYACLAALRPGVTVAQASAELNAAQARIARSFPEKIELRASLVPLQAQITGRAGSGLRLLLAAVAVVLLVGCVNIANLLLSRVTGRRREIAIRAAVGASPARLVRQVLAETLLMSAAGGAAGVAIAHLGVHAIRTYAPADIPRLDEVAVDGRVLLFTMLLVVAAGVLSGILPAWRLARTDPHDAATLGGRGTAAARGGRLRGALVAAEVALSALCLVIGGLLLHSFVRLVNVDAGFARREAIALSLDLPRHRYADDPQRIAYIRRVLERLEALPGVASAGVVNQLPLGGEGGNNLVAPEGFAGQISDRPLADVRQVNGAYFGTLGIPLVSGRVFDEADGDHPVALLSAATAARLFPGVDAVGRRIIVGDAKTADVTVAGIVGDVRGVSLDRAPSLTIYVPYWQRFYGGPTFVVRPAGEPAAVSAAVARALREIDPEVPLPAFRSMEEIVSASLADRRFQVRLVLLFGIAAALLASLGIYGVVSYSVAQRTSELGVRMALGAPPARILALVVGQSLRPVGVGLALGLTGAVAAGRLARGLLFGVSPLDPVTLGGVFALLGVVATMATIAPARRAMRVDPVVALRDE